MPEDRWCPITITTLECPNCHEKVVLGHSDPALVHRITNKELIENCPTCHEENYD